MFYLSIFFYIYRRFHFLISDSLAAVLFLLRELIGASFIADNLLSQVSFN